MNRHLCHASSSSFSQTLLSTLTQIEHLDCYHQHYPPSHPSTSQPLGKFLMLLLSRPFLAPLASSTIVHVSRRTSKDLLWEDLLFFCLFHSIILSVQFSRVIGGFKHVFASLIFCLSISSRFFFCWTNLASFDLICSS